MNGGHGIKSLILSIIIFLLALIPWIPLNPYIHHVITIIMLFAYLGTAWNILGGYAGQVSLGHAAFFGLGAYFTYFFLKWLNITPLIGMLMAAGVSVGAASTIGFVAFRFGLKGIYFALATIAFAEIMREVFIAFRDITGGSLGVSYPALGYNPFYFQFPERSGKGSVDEIHPLSLGVVGDLGRWEHAVEAVEKRDLIIVVGSKLPQYATYNWKLLENKSIIHIDIDPEELERNFSSFVKVSRRCQGNFKKIALPSIWMEIRRRVG